MARLSLRTHSAVMAATVAIALLLGALPAAAAPGGDALVQAMSFVALNQGNPSASATVMCPSGTRATGGGVAPTSPLPGIDNYRVQLSGPVDATGAVVTTDTGDAPRGWAATVSHFGAQGDETFRIFALCSRNSDAVIQAAPATGGGPLYQDAPVCAAGTRAIGGGVGSLSEVPAGEQDYLIFSSHPVDATMTTSGTATGDVARAWATSILTQGGTAPRFFSICSAKSDAKVQARAFTLAAHQTAGATVTCPPMTRALSGGMGTNSALDQASDRLEYSAPTDDSGAVTQTNDGDIGRRWLAAGRNTTDSDRTFRVLAVCASSEPRPDGHVKRASDSTFVGQDVYSPTKQSRGWSATRGQTRSFNLRFQNDGETDQFTIRGCATRATLNATYINPKNGANVTAKVAGDGYVISSLPHRAHRSLVLRLKPTSSAVLGSTLSCRVTVTSALKTTVIDAVVARVRVVQP